MGELGKSGIVSANFDSLETETEIPVVKGSSLIGMKVGDIIEEFEVKFEHYHNPLITERSRIDDYSIAKKKVIECGAGIKVKGKAENVDRLLLFAFE